MFKSRKMPSRARIRVGEQAGPYSAEVLHSPQRIRALSEEASHLFTDQSDACNPQFFLASIDDNAWAPVVAVVRHENTTVGILYAKERKFARTFIGLVYADATLHTMLVASPAERAPVLRAALRAVIETPGIMGLRIVVPPDGFEHDAIEGLLEARALDARYSQVKNHSALELPPGYETFLGSLGSRTRRNFRYYRRRFEDSGGAYIQNIPLEEFERVARELEMKCVPMAGRKGIERDIRMLSTIKDPIFVGLKSSGGEWLSVLGGWYDADRAVVFLQLNNDRDYPRSALCTVLRGYFIERLISRNVPTLLFWGGAVGNLLPYCEYLPAVCAQIDRPTLIWRSIRAVIGWSIDFLPPNYRRSARWAASRVSHEQGETV